SAYLCAAKAPRATASSANSEPAAKKNRSMGLGRDRESWTWFVFENYSKLKQKIRNVLIPALDDVKDLNIYWFIPGSLLRQINGSLLGPSFPHVLSGNPGEF